MKGDRRPAGEVRQSQMLTTFGPGAMVDLPTHSVLVGGLEFWVGHRERVYEERLEAWLLEKLHDQGATEIKLFAPPVPSADPTAAPGGVKVIEFPGWFLGQVDETYVHDGKSYRTRPLIRGDRRVKGGYLDRDRRVRPVVPVRFVQACVRGHISDIDWYAFVRRDFAAAPNGDLWLDEGGSGNDFAEIFVRDERTGQRRPLSEAKVPTAGVLGTCRGARPWLGPRMHVPCVEPNRLLARSASNAYFSVTQSVISIPEADKELKDAVSRVFEDFLQYCESEADVRRERKKEKVAVALEGWADGDVWAEVQRRLSKDVPVPKGIRQAEIETLLSAKPGTDKPEGDFFARQAPIPYLPAAARGKVDRLVLVHRLREVVAQVGFTRFEPVVPDVDGALSIGVEVAPIYRDLSWLPAFQNRGEGVFLSFPSDAIEAWQRRPAVQERSKRLMAGFNAWKQDRGGEAAFVGMPYLMLHSLSHLLITALSLDCGYSASSIRERVYAGESGYGILLYTGSPGSEGTLGGLVDVGRNIGRHLERALEMGRLCSNDPVCAQHDPADRHEARFLHGSACHGCLLIAETCCERRNELLDRALIVPTVTSAGTAYFDGGA